MAQALLSRYPWVSSPFVVSAPMKVMSSPALAVAVSRAGGLGFIGPGAKTQDTNDDLANASVLIRGANPIPTTNTVLPIGVGYQLWADDLGTAVSAIEKYKPCAAWLYAPKQGPEDYEYWSSKIRQACPDTQIWIQIGTIKEAKQLLQISERPDVVVVQGAESGGHGRANDGMGLMSLLPELVDIMASSRIPVFGAGGIADGRGVAAAMCLGASGAVMGTRFLAATEARISRGYQDEVVRASDGAVSTTRTLLYNHLRGTFGWPKEYSPRTIVNQSFVDQQQGKSFEELQKLHDEATKAGDKGWGPTGRLATYAGASIGLIHDVKNAGDIVRETRNEALERIRHLFPYKN